jgi:hypothetical protein
MIAERTLEAGGPDFVGCARPTNQERITTKKKK